MTQKTQSSRASTVSIGPRKRGPILIAVVLAGIAIAAFFWWRQETRKIRAGSYRDLNVLLITLDTTRADHLPAYGYRNVHTPSLDAIASRSFVFEEAFAHVPITLPSHAAILTGRLPIANGVRDNSGYFLDPKETTIAERLKAAGYNTAAFVSAFVLDSRWQLNQGFDFYFDNFNLAEHEGVNPREIERRAEETELEAAHWLGANAGKKWFAWVHFYDPHDPYDPPEPYRTEYADHPYDGEIAYMDESVGRLMQKLRELGEMERTVVIVTADHGEGLGEHQEATHAMFLYSSTIRVPLLISLPGAGNHRIQGIARHVDVVPTILELLGIPVASEIQGQSLLPMMNGDEKSVRAVYSESLYSELHYGWSALKSLTREQYRYIDAPRAELYDWKADPAESRNLVPEKDSVARVMKSALNEIVERDTGNVQGPQKVDPETEEKLRALGYVSGGAASTPASRRIDPKDKIHLADALQKASGLAIAGRHQEALALVLPVVREDPGMTEAHYIAGISYAGVGQYQQAIDEFLKMIRLKPDHTTALYNLAYAYQVLGDLKSAEFWYRKILQYDPEHVSAMVKLVGIYRLLNQPEAARPFYVKAVEYYENALRNTRSSRGRASLNASMAELYFLAGDLQNAAGRLRTAVELDPKKPDLHYNLAQVYESAGAPDQAIEEYRKETEVNPSAFRAYHNLGLLLAQQRKFEDAARCFEQVTRLNPSDPAGFYLLAAAYRQLGRAQEAEQILKALPK